MKNSFKKILAVGMTLALVSSFFAAVPVSAAPGCNAWDDIAMPVLAPDTEVGVMDIAPDGTMFLAFYDEDAEEWDIKYSTDGGFNWKDTNLTGIYDDDPNDLYGFDDGDGTTPVRIQVSPMWPNNKNVYVALSNGDVWRLPNAGLGTPALLKPIVSNNSTYLEDMGWGLWDMDIWADGTYNYLVVATDLDVFVLKDQLLNDWIDYELNEDSDDGSWWGNRRAVEVRFAPDFATSELIWAVVAEDNRDIPDYADPAWTDNDLILTSADSPARWGYVFQEVAFEQYDNDLEWWTPFVDMEFDPAYTAEYPQLYVAVAQPWWINSGYPSPNEPGNLYYVAGEASSTGPGDVGSTYIFFEDRALGTVEVSGNTIMVQDSEDGTVWTTTDGGANWVEASRSPAAPFWGQLYMAPDFDESGIVFSTVMDGNGFDGVSGLYRSTDGGDFFDGISLLDMYITEIKDMAFDPKGGSQPALMVVAYDLYDYIFYTSDATAASPQWLLKDCETAFNDSFGAIEMVSWDIEGDTVMILTREGFPWDYDYSIYRSTDDGNSFNYWRSVPTGTIDIPTDWVVVDSSIVNIVGRDGFWATKAIGTPITKTVLDGIDLSAGWPAGARSIARFENTVAVGTMGGGVAVSADGGATWDSASPFSVDVYVAFGPDGTLYAATGNSSIYVIDGDLDAEMLEDSNGDVADAIAFSGIWVSPDNTLYAIGTSIDEGAVSYDYVVSGSVQLYNDTFPFGTATLDLAKFADYAESETSGSSITVDWISGSPIVGEILYVVGDDLVWGGTFDVDAEPVDAYMTGDILVQGAESGAFFRISLNVSMATADAMVAAGDLPYADGWADLWPEDGVSVSISSSTIILGLSSEAEEDDEGPEMMWRLLLGDNESDYNVWETKTIDGAEGIWGTSGSNIIWTIVDNIELWAFEDFNSGTVQNVTVVEVDKSPATASKNLQVSWTSLACTTCYTVWIDGEPYTNFTVASSTAAGTTITKKLTGFDYATEYEVQVQACVNGPIQSRLSAVDDVTTECYLLAPVAAVPVQGMQDASTAPSFVWNMPAMGCVPTGYDFQLSTDPAFATTIVSISTTNTGYTYAAGDLAYDTNHYWRVRSSYGTVKSAWTTIQNFHTMLEPQPPVDITITQPPDVNLTVPPVVTVPPAQTITVSVPPAVTLTQTVTSVPTPTITLPDQPTPAYIWVIVAVGAILTIAVIVLIIRTRRAE